jgi:YVTN family beta-propeller protein
MVQTTIPGFNEPSAVAVTPNGEFVYVTDFSGTTVSMINTNTNMITATIPGFNLPAAVAITPNGEFVYVTNDGNASVSVVNANTNMITATVTVGTGPSGAAITPDGNFVYVANIGTNNVSVIATLSPSTFTYEDHNRMKGVATLYSVTSFDASGNESAPMNVTIN